MSDVPLLSLMYRRWAPAWPVVRRVGMTTKSSRSLNLSIKKDSVIANVDVASNYATWEVWKCTENVARLLDVSTGTGGHCEFRSATDGSYCLLSSEWDVQCGQHIIYTVFPTGATAHIPARLINVNLRLVAATVLHALFFLPLPMSVKLEKSTRTFEGRQTERSEGDARSMLTYRQVYWVRWAFAAGTTSALGARYGDISR